MDDSKLLELRLVSTPSSSRAPSYATASPVVAMVDRVRNRVHARQTSRDQAVFSYPPRISSSGWRKRHSAARFSIASSSSAATFVTAPASPPSPSIGSISDAATPDTPFTPFESERELKSKYAAPSIIITPPERVAVAAVAASNSNPSHCYNSSSLRPTSSYLASFPLPSADDQKSTLSPLLTPLSRANKQIWKDLTDDIVKGYMRANYVFTDKLERLREKAVGNQEYLESIEAMMEKTLLGRQRIAVAGERIHARVDNSKDSLEVERGLGLADLGLGVKIVKDTIERPISWLG